MANTLSFQTTAMPGGNGGLGLNFNLGPSTAQLAQQSFNFLSGVNSTDQGFLNQSITGSQNFLASQLQPLTAALSNASAGLSSASAGLSSATAGMSSMSSALASSMGAGTGMMNTINQGLPSIVQWTGNELGGAISNQLSTTQQTINPTNVWGYANMANAFQSNEMASLNQNYQTASNQQFALANQIAGNQLQEAKISSQNVSSGGGGGGGCYITTAICKSENKPDDCDELIIFRSFRDTYMQENEARKELIQLYYKDAPVIVAKILSKDNADEMLNYLKTHYLMPSYDAIKSGDYKAAFEKYCDMVYFAATL